LKLLSSIVVKFQEHWLYPPRLLYSFYFNCFESEMCNSSYFVFWIFTWIRRLVFIFIIVSFLQNKYRLLIWK
jgi:hypothetical protein